jgi:hypothetical protein
MKYLYLLIVLVYVAPVFAQPKKLYLTSDNKFTESKDSASIYLVINKHDKDSLYSMSQYTIRDSLLLTGVFKDSTLTMPEGNFVYYYTPAEIFIWKNTHIIGTDTNKYIKNTGSYIDGKKNGLWETYDYNGDLQNRVTYKDDVLSGAYEFIDNTPTGITAHVYNGTNADGKKEGEAKVTSMYGRLEETRYYHDDQLAKTVVNKKVTKGIIQPSAPINFKAYLNKQMAMYAKDTAGIKAVVKFTVDKSGMVKDLSIREGYDDMAKNQAVIDLVKNSGKWKAGSIDGHHADMITFCTINLTDKGFTYALPKY